MFEIKPKTRKEIYMAYLAGDMSLELPEPMTRDEVTLYNLCQSHAYGSTTTVKEVLAEFQPEYDPDGIYALPDNVVFVAGEEYIVNWNGVEYRCVAQDASNVAPGFVAVGDASEVGLNGNGEPFVLSSIAGVGATAQLPGGGRLPELIISIRQETETIHPIDPKYLPSGGGGDTIVFRSDGVSTVECDMAGAEIVRAVHANPAIRAVMIGEMDEDNSVVLQCAIVQFTSELAAFVFTSGAYNFTVTATENGIEMNAEQVE